MKISTLTYYITIMILRIGLLDDAVIVGNTCDNQELDRSQIEDMSVKITVDGTVVINTTDLATYVFPASVVTTANSILVDNMGLDDTGAEVGTGKIRLQINMPNIWDKTSVKVEISKATCYPYSETFEVYGYDLGNNDAQDWLNLSLQQNPDFTIELKKIENNINGEQTVAISRLISYRKPFTNEVYFYNSVSTGGQKLYTFSFAGTQIGTNGFICAGAVTISQTNNIYNVVGMTSTIVNTCTKSIDIDVAPVVDVPFNTDITCDNCPAECEDCASCDTTTEQENTATTFANYNDLSTYWQNDIEVYPFDAQRIVYNLYDYTGALIETLTYDYTINPPPFVFDQTLYRLNGFTLPTVGDYLLEVTLSIPGLRSCTKRYTINNCNWYEVEQIECNQYKVYNRAFEEITLVVKKLNDSHVFETVSTTDIALLDFTTITLDTDGIYTFEVTRGAVTYTFVVIVYCNLKTCLFNKLNSLICANENNLCKDKSYYEFNALILNAHTYFGMLNNEYNFNYIYTALTANHLEELYQINDFITRFEEYCENCDANCEECSKTNLNCTECG